MTHSSAYKEILALAMQLSTIEKLEIIEFLAKSIRESLIEEEGRKSDSKFDDTTSDSANSPI